MLLVLTNVVTCVTRGSSSLSTASVLISRLLGSHLKFTLPAVTAVISEKGRGSPAAPHDPLRPPAAPARVTDAVNALKAAGCDIPVASVAAGFPSGQTPLETKLAEIKLAVQYGAREIDIVISRSLVLSGQWEGLYEEIRQCREACGEAHMKTILATGELGSLANVYKASMIAMMAGSDFIKTSTGKEVENATLPVGVVMMRAIKEFYWQTGFKVGFKPAGGIRTAKEAITWLMLVKEELGVEWLKPELFRLGASSLLEDIEKQIFHHVTGSYALPHDLAMA